jgi:RNA ligase (TIGR02306 family)
MERKLASIQRVESISPIYEADNIVKARILGWDVIVKKNEFKVGDLCVFFEIDSILPIAPWSQFMQSRKYRVKTVRMKGVLSQGLALPTSILIGNVFEVGLDISKSLGVTKYEPAIPSLADNKEIAGAFPGGVPKTDETRLQSVLGVLDELRGKDFYITTKLDGQSATFYKPSPEEPLMACSRNYSIKNGDNALWRVAEQYSLESKIPAGYAVQGELCGPGIQQNRLRLKSVDFFVYNIYNVSDYYYLNYEVLISVSKKLGLKTVPVEQVVTGDSARSFDHSLDNYLKLAKGLYVDTVNRKEGIVVRPLVACRSHALGGRLSFKVINNDFLLKDED